MAQQTINVGAAPNDGTGTPLRTAFQYTNSNFSELYTALGGGSGLPGATTQVIFNDGGTNLAGDAGLVYNKTTDALTIGGNVQAASATITGAATVGTTLGVTGVSTFAAGTAALPALTTTGDTNTGIFYPAADTFAVTTGGSERYRVDSSGNVGIGVTPSYRLDVSASGTISSRFKTSGALNALYIEDSGTTAGSLYIASSGNEFRVVTGSNIALAIDVNRNFSIGPTSVTTTATDGFVYVPVCAGAPTGIPTAKGGRAAFVVDSTNNRFYVYVNGAWKYAALV